MTSWNRPAERRGTDTIVSMRRLRRRGLGLVWSALALAPVIAALAVTQLISTQDRNAYAHGARAAFPLTQGHWKETLNSLFTGRELNLPWANSRFGNGAVAAGFNPYELECFDPSRVAVAAGGLMLRIVRRPQLCDGRWRPYSSGIASTVGRWSFRYGLMEARVWVPSRGRRILDWPAVWLGGGAEIDVFEGGGVPCWYYHIDHRRWGRCVGGIHITNGWHTVAVNWQPRSITWYYDRREVGRLSSALVPIASSRMSVVLDLAISDKMPHEPTVVPATFRIGWVRVWQHAG